MDLVKFLGFTASGSAGWLLQLRQDGYRANSWSGRCWKLAVSQVWWCKRRSAKGKSQVTSKPAKRKPTQRCVCGPGLVRRLRLAGCNAKMLTASAESRGQFIVQNREYMRISYIPFGNKKQQNKFLRVQEQNKRPVLVRLFNRAFFLSSPVANKLIKWHLAWTHRILSTVSPCHSWQNTEYFLRFLPPLLRDSNWPPSSHRPHVSDIRYYCLIFSLGGW